jgi:site-specific DNA recombinase
LDAIIQRLYEDHVMGKLNAERFAKLSEGYEKEQSDLKQSVETLRAIVNAAETQAVNIQSFLKIVRKYTEPTELTPALLREFVEKVVVHAPDKSSGHRIQRIDIHYNFIGEIDFSPEFSRYSKKTTA